MRMKVTQLAMPVVYHRDGETGRPDEVGPDSARRTSAQDRTEADVAAIPETMPAVRTHGPRDYRVEAVPVPRSRC
jgi:hypothetical protein